MRQLKFSDALSEGLVQSMERDENIFVTGIAVDYPSGIFGSTIEATQKFGPSRVFDAPAMENALTGIMIGAAAMGKRPVFVHPRCDFLFLAMDQLINLAAKWKYMYGGNAGSVPVVIRAMIGKGWGQGATHSQSLQSIFAHFPGLNVVMPATPQDAKGLTIAALQSESPTIIFEHRSLFETTGDVADEFAPTKLGVARVARVGTDVTVVATSAMVQEAEIAAQEIAKQGISLEVVDLRSIRPLDEETILGSVRKTGRLIVADTSWAAYGVASEIAALAAEKALQWLKAPVIRIACADCPAPVSKSLEDVFYPGATTIANAAMEVFGTSKSLSVGDIDTPDDFMGPY